ncbi:hypothetical protein GQ600_8733 [Phytophthora cactorum]|nr:hypothetical protein GQ600_8733 [Phytophthora cactorum]
MWTNKVAVFQWMKKLGNPTEGREENRRRIMADGFNVTMKYKDGTGEVEIPGTDNSQSTHERGPYRLKANDGGKRNVEYDSQSHRECVGARTQGTS